MADDTEKRLNVRSTEGEIKVWTEAANAEHLDLSTWLRRLAWQAVERWREKAKKKRGRG